MEAEQIPRLTSKEVDVIEDDASTHITCIIAHIMGQQQQQQQRQHEEQVHPVMSVADKSRADPSYTTQKLRGVVSRTTSPQFRG